MAKTKKRRVRVPQGVMAGLRRIFAGLRTSRKGLRFRVGVARNQDDTISHIYPYQSFLVDARGRRLPPTCTRRYYCFAPKRRAHKSRTAPPRLTTPGASSPEEREGRSPLKPSTDRAGA